MSDNEYDIDANEYLMINNEKEYNEKEYNEKEYNEKEDNIKYQSDEESDEESEDEESDDESEEEINILPLLPLCWSKNRDKFNSIGDFLEDNNIEELFKNGQIYQQYEGLEIDDLRDILVLYNRMNTDIEKFRLGIYTKAKQVRQPANIINKLIRVAGSYIDY